MKHIGHTTVAIQDRTQNANKTARTCTTSLCRLHAGRRVLLCRPLQALQSVVQLSHLQRFPPGSPPPWCCMRGAVVKEGNRVSFREHWFSRIGDIIFQIPFPSKAHLYCTKQPRAACETALAAGYLGARLALFVRPLKKNRRQVAAASVTHDIPGWSRHVCMIGKCS